MVEILFIDGGIIGDVNKNIFFLMEIVCVVVFMVEYIVCLYVVLDCCKFVCDFMSVIDVVVILFYYVGLFMLNNFISGVFVILRVFRIFRIFKFFRYFCGFWILGYMFKSCVLEFGFLLFFFLMVVIIFVIVMYYVEKEEFNIKFESIFVSFWYIIVMMIILGWVKFLIFFFYYVNLIMCVLFNMFIFVYKY